MEIVKMGKYTVGIKPQQDFEKWIRAKNDITKFYALNDGEKEAIFLSWKHGFTNGDSNAAIEDNLKQFKFMISRYKDEDWKRLDEGTKEYYQYKIRWSNECDRIWQGILARSNTLKRNPSGYN